MIDATKPNELPSFLPGGQFATTPTAYGPNAGAAAGAQAGGISSLLSDPTTLGIIAAIGVGAYFLLK